MRISSSFAIIFVWAGQSLFCWTLMLGWYLYIKVSLNLTTLDAIWFKTGTDDDHSYIPMQVLTSELGLRIGCHVSVWLHQQLFTYGKESNITNINKQNGPTGRYGRLHWISLTLLQKFVCCYFLNSLYMLS